MSDERIIRPHDVVPAKRVEAIAEMTGLPLHVVKSYLFYDWTELDHIQWILTASNREIAEWLRYCYDAQ